MPPPPAVHRRPAAVRRPLPTARCPLPGLLRLPSAAVLRSPVALEFRQRRGTLTVSMASAGTAGGWEGRQCVFARAPRDGSPRPWPRGPPLSPLTPAPAHVSCTRAYGGERQRPARAMATATVALTPLLAGGRAQRALVNAWPGAVGNRAR